MFCCSKIYSLKDIWIFRYSNHQKIITFSSVSLIKIRCLLYLCLFLCFDFVIFSKIEIYFFILFAYIEILYWHWLKPLTLLPFWVMALGHCQHRTDIYKISVADVHSFLLSTIFAKNVTPERGKFNQWKILSTANSNIL